MALTGPGSKSMGKHGGAGEVAGEHHAVGDGFEEVVVADVGDGGVVGVGVLGGVAVGGEDDVVAGEIAAEGVGDYLAVAAVEVDAGVAEGGEVEEVVGGPEAGGEDVGDAGLAAAVAGVAFGHAPGDGFCSPAERRAAASRMSWARRATRGWGRGCGRWSCRGWRAGRRCSSGARGRRCGTGGMGGEAGADSGEPLGVAGDVGHAEAGGGDDGEDGVGEGEPLVHVELGGPGGGVAEMGLEEVGLVAELEVFELPFSWTWPRVLATNLASSAARAGVLVPRLMP